MPLDKLEVIKPGALINVQVSTAFYARIQELALYFSRLVTPEELSEQIEILKGTGEGLSEYGEHFQTILTLANEIEDQARLQSHTEMRSTSPDQGLPLSA
jgi:hypothetical protein